MEASPEICSASFPLGEVAGGLGLHRPEGCGWSPSSTSGSSDGGEGRAAFWKPGRTERARPRLGTTSATCSRDGGRLALPWWGIRVGSTERLVLLLKFCSGHLPASVSDQGVKAKVSMPSAPLASRLCPNECALSHLTLDLLCSSGGRASTAFTWGSGEIEDVEKSLVRAAAWGSNSTAFTSQLTVVQ